MNINKIKATGKKIKFEIFEKFTEIKEGHPGSVLSIFDIVNFLLFSSSICFVNSFLD